MFNASQWHPATVVRRKVWDDGLWTVTLDLARDFRPGQFCTLGLEVGGAEVKRAYSIASAPGEPLEFYVVVVDDGALTPSLWRLEPGDRVYVRDRISGLFTLDRMGQGGTVWLLSTGTGLAPYVSMLRERGIFGRFEHVVVVHGVRHARQLAYRDELEAIARTRPVTYVPTCTRDEVEGVLHGRLPDLVRSGALEERVGRRLSPQGHHVMLCGNPQMVIDMLGLLRDRDMVLHKPRQPGQVHIERYW